MICAIDAPKRRMQLNPVRGLDWCATLESYELNIRDHNMDSGTRICGFRRPEQGAQMNWKQKVLTILALILFLTIGWLHLAEIGKRTRSSSYWVGESLRRTLEVTNAGPTPNLLRDLRPDVRGSLHSEIAATLFSRNSVSYFPGTK
jgi:hypothetical protein